MPQSHLSRRELIAAALAAAPIAAQQSPRKRPNVLLIIADDMNDFGFHMGYKGIQTPHLDRFRNTAHFFERAYCASPAFPRVRPSSADCFPTLPAPI